MKDVEAASTTEGEGLLSVNSDEIIWNDEKLEPGARRAITKSRTLWLIPLAIFTLCIFALVGVLLFGASRTNARTTPEKTCEPGMPRPEWRSLPLHRRHAYTAAVQRLTLLPSRLGLNTSLYDDFTYVHIQSAYQIHHAALSLPWHRYFLHVFETALKEEAAYDGVVPYWDWTLDAADPMKSPIWDDWFGFGGNGTSPHGCVTAGILGSMTVDYAEEGYFPHCVTRNFENDPENGEMHGNKYTPEIVQSIVKISKTYDEFREKLESGPHRHLHLGIGGEMPTISSTNDPLFFVHHAQIDRLWWLWQRQNPEKRNQEFSGILGSVSSTGTNGEATLDDKILMFGLAEDCTVREVMTTSSNVLCYKYSKEF